MFTFNLIIRHGTYEQDFYDIAASLLANHGSVYNNNKLFSEGDILSLKVTNLRGDFWGKHSDTNY